ncbi:PAS domain-containing sensor histidine kinase [Halodesulfovibrio marinisediminis]|uniref:PAS fold-containing protein n=1 Tax=Halodesulfovibrio marinisediminis DSM 17456 TaxID=1121457 RepID=A0A1N6IB92_9BACT|nr:ATP-binding protein [Halodesulfovibrio marinisediminis]SIO29273.1 PAS fold-containing protein [Halodesulfovibrio marinisediminis DSM 17456]
MPNILKNSVVVDALCLSGIALCMAVAGAVYFFNVELSRQGLLVLLCGVPIVILSLVAFVYRKQQKEIVENKTALLIELADTKLQVRILQRSETLMQSIFNASQNVYYVFDEFCVCQNVITSREDLLRCCHPVEPTGKKLAELFDEKMSNTIRRALLKSLDCKRLQILEYCVEHAGKEYWLEGRALALPQHGCGPRKIVWVARDITEEKRNREAVRVLSTRLALSEEQQRRKIAVELHDSLGQILAIVKMRLNLLRRYLSEGDELALLDSSMEQLGSGIELTRTLVWELSPPTLYALGLVSAVEWLGEKYAKEHDIEFIVEDDLQCCIWGSDFKIIMFRIVRELMANVVKHSGASSCTIEFYNRSDGVVITVHDNGKGFPDRTAGGGFRKGFGLLTIQESVRHLGGDVTFTTNSVGGNVLIFIPFKQAAPALNVEMSAATGTYDG